MDISDEALKQMSSEQLLVLEQRLTQVLQRVKNRKIQKLMEELNPGLQTELTYLQDLTRSPLYESLKDIIKIQDSETTLSLDPTSGDTMAESNSIGSHAQDPTLDVPSESEAGSSRNSHT